MTRTAAILLVAGTLHACGEDDPPNPNDCPMEATEDLVTCVELAFGVAGDQAYRLPLAETIDDCLQGSPRDLEGLVPACRARLAIELEAEPVLTSVLTPAPVTAGVAAARGSCPAASCQVFATHFEVHFARRPSALRHDLAVEDALTMIPAAQTWDVSSRTITGAALDRAAADTALQDFGAGGTGLVDALFSLSSSGTPTVATFSRSLRRNRTVLDQTILMVLTPRDGSDLLQLIDVQRENPFP